MNEEKPSNPRMNSDSVLFDCVTLRDHFAGLALQGHLASEYYTGCNTEQSNIDAIVKNMYAFADAMLKQRES